LNVLVLDLAIITEYLTAQLEHVEIILVPLILCQSRKFGQI